MNNSEGSNQFLSNTAVPLAKKWMAECQESHPSCRKAARHSSIFCTDNAHFIYDLSADNLLPSRLLALKPVVYLAESSSLPADTQYVALSHRWGTKSSFLTTRKNVSQRTQVGLCPQNLPRTFREAMDVTLGLGYSYLWIDSLCIVQDDQDDWKKEARRMAVVFDKAAVTIAAMDGVDCDSGLIVKKPDKDDVGVLSTRASVCQEQMISPRSLVFTQETVEWECREAIASEEVSKLQPRPGSSGTERIPTNLKDMFVFFRDWRLPPNPAVIEEAEPEPDAKINPAEVVDGEETEPNSQPNVDQDAVTHDAEKESQAQDGQALVQALIQTSDRPSDQALDHASDTDSLYIDPETGAVVMNYGDDIPDHAAHLKEFFIYNGPGMGNIFTVYPDDDSDEPFGTWMKVVTELSHPIEAFYPFLKTWWQFISLYTPRLLTYDSDKFLAINGITSVAQRWTHIRSSFGLWFHFFETDLCWYVDPSGPQASRPKTWLVPSWSWASTRHGCVRNDLYTRFPTTGYIQIKPEIRTPVGTSFDMPLPFSAWGRDLHSMGLSGSLRKAIVTAGQDSNSQIHYSIDVEPTARLSDHEVCDFRPDCQEEFPVGEAIEVYCIHMRHFHAEHLNLPEYVDIYLVLVQAGERKGIHLQLEDIDEEELLKERTMRRVGYLEIKYGVDEKRSDEAIAEDAYWWWIQLI